MLTFFVIALTVSCAALTVAFLGTLRGIAEVQLRVRGVGSENKFRLNAGTSLPDVLMPSLSNPRALGLLLFVSEGCSACWQILEELPKLNLGGAPVAVCRTSAGPGTMRERFASSQVTWIEETIAIQVVQQLGITSTPVIIVHRDGYVVGTAHGSSAESMDTIRRLWTAASSPTGFRVQRAGAIDLSASARSKRAATPRLKGGINHDRI